MGGIQEWAQHYGVALCDVVEDVRSKSISRTEVPIIFVGTIAGRAVGAVELKLFENKEFTYEHWLSGLFVVPLKRGSGFAKTLLLFAIRYATQLGVQELYLQCTNKN